MRKLAAGLWVVLPFLMVLACGGSGGGALRQGVTGLELERRITLGDGVSFGAAGAYEVLTGTAHYALDPGDQRNSRVADLRLAERGTDGLVRYRAELVILKPVDVSRGNGALLYHVVNRGNFDQRLLDPAPWSEVAAAPSGSTEWLGRLMKQGFTVVFSGWQDDLLAPPPGEPSRLRLYAPEAREEGGAVPAGLALAEFEADSAGQTVAALATPGHRAWPVDPAQAVAAELRVHDSHADPGTVIARDRWRFARLGEDGAAVDDSISVYLSEGYQPGKIYTVSYRPSRATVMGLAFPAVRDLVALLSSGDSLNPLVLPDGRCPIRYRLAFGSSQCGRFLRNFLYDGFNRALDGGRVFEGVFANVPGGRLGFFNYRFAQPSRAWGFYPEFVPPFADLPSADPVSGFSAGILDNLPAELQPKIFHVHHAGEYWSSGAALTHAEVTGARDLELPDNVRIYTMVGMGHGAAKLTAEGRPEDGPAWPGDRPFYLLPSNPNPAHFLEAPLFEALARWVMFEEAPPESRYPRFDREELTPLESFTFPTVPEVQAPVLAQAHPRFDFGERWREGVLAHPLPELGPEYPVFVPAVDEDGNELGGLRSPFVAVPVASYTGWNYPAGWFAGYDGTRAARLSGAWLPFCADQAQRKKLGDSRLSLAERYNSRALYLEELRAAAQELIDQRLLLPEDLPLVLQQGGSMYGWVAAHGAWRMATKGTR